MNTRTAGVISLIAFLTALVTIVWILSLSVPRERVVRIDTVPRRATPATPVYTREGQSDTGLENPDADS